VESGNSFGRWLFTERAPSTPQTDFRYPPNNVVTDSIAGRPRRLYRRKTAQFGATMFPDRKTQLPLTSDTQFVPPCPNHPRKQLMPD